MSIIRFHAATDERPNDYMVTAATAVDDSTAVDIRDFAGGGISVPDTSSAGTLTYHAATHPGGPFRELHDRDNGPITQAVTAGKSYPLPDELYGFGGLKITADAEVQLTISLKG